MKARKTLLFTAESRIKVLTASITPLSMSYIALRRRSRGSLDRILVLIADSVPASYLLSLAAINIIDS
jgi:hypothetical protein